MAAQGQGALLSRPCAVHQGLFCYKEVLVYSTTTPYPKDALRERVSWEKNDELLNRAYSSLKAARPSNRRYDTREMMVIEVISDLSSPDIHVWEACGAWV